MGTLMEKFRQTVAKNSDPRMKTEGGFNVLYPTGFPCFDFINGCKIHVNDEKSGKKYSYYSVGVTDGSCCMLIGRSGCGKTTFGLQMCANIIRQFPEAELYYDDIEGGINDARKRLLMQMSSAEIESRCRYRNTGITAENFYETIKLIHDIKMQNYEEYQYDTGLYDTHGNKVFKLVPTCYLLDSVTMLMPSSLSEEEQLSGSMSASAAAKTNTSVFKRILPMLKAANIILVEVAHINDAIAISAFNRKQAQVSYLKPEESISGGKILVYTANLLLRFNDNSKLKPDDGLKIDGSLVDIEIVKSRSGKSGSTCTLVFDKENGFDSDLSLYIMLKNAKMINGAGAYLYIGDRKDKTFRQSELKKKLAEDPEFAEIFMNAAMKILITKINDAPEFASDGSDRPYSLSQAISNKLLTIMEEE